MTGKLLLSLAAIAAVVACTDDAPVDELTAHTELVCREANASNTLWDDDELSCHTYLDTCVENLTPNQRVIWFEQVDACADRRATFECYAKVPWC